MRPTAVLLLVVLAGCARRVPPPDTRSESFIMDASGHELSNEALLNHLEASRYVLLGERHDDLCVHVLQERIVRLAGRAGLSFAVGLEMVDVDFVAPLAAFNEDRLTLSALRHAVDWDKRWGFDWWLYAPVFETAKEFEVPLAPLNMPKRLMNADAENPDVSADVLEHWLSPETLPPPDAQRVYLREVFNAHAEHLPPAVDREVAFEKFVHAQSAWDTQMAWAARHVASVSERAFVLVGAGHVENGWGIEHRLSQLDPQAPVLSFVPWPGPEKPDAQEADLFFVCPSPTPSAESSAR